MFLFCCSHAVATEVCILHVLKQMATLCMIMWHRQGKGVGLHQTTVLKEKGRNEKPYENYKEQKEKA